MYSRRIILSNRQQCAMGASCPRQGIVCLRLKLSMEINLSAIPANTLPTSTNRYYIEKNIKKVESDFAVDNHTVIHNIHQANLHQGSKKYSGQTWRQAGPRVAGQACWIVDFPPLRSLHSPIGHQLQDLVPSYFRGPRVNRLTRAMHPGQRSFVPVGGPTHKNHLASKFPRLVPSRLEKKEEKKRKQSDGGSYHIPGMEFIRRPVSRALGRYSSCSQSVKTII